MEDRKRRKAALACAAAALALCAAGCAGKETSKESGQEEITLTVLAEPSPETVTGAWKGEGADKLYEDTGLRVEFYSGGGDERRLKQYLAAGTLPDVIGFADMEQAQLLSGAGVLLDLDAYGEELSGVFAQEEYSAALRYFREIWGGEEERLYFLPTQVGARDKDEYYWMPMLQWNAYKKAGYPALETLEDYLDAAELMRGQKPTTPLGERVYGFSLCGEWSGISSQQPSSLSWLYGIDTGRVSPLIEADTVSGEIRAVTAEDSFYKRALRFYYEANQRRLLDPDSRTQNAETLKGKYESGQILFSNFCWLTGDYGSADGDGYAALAAADMKIYRETDNPVGGGWYYGVNKNCGNPEAACTLLNWLYDPENMELLYNDGEDTFASLGLTAASPGEDGEALGHEFRSEEKQKRESTAPAREIFSWRGGSLTDALAAKGQLCEGSAAVRMLDVLTDELQKKSGQMEELVEELSWEMIYAADGEEFESLWEEMRAACEKLGIKELESFYKQAWETAKERERIYGTKEEP